MELDLPSTQYEIVRITGPVRGRNRDNKTSFIPKTHHRAAAFTQPFRDFPA
jgi:hypothetical protein